MIEVRPEGCISEPCSDISLNGRGMGVYVAKDKILA